MMLKLVILKGFNVVQIVCGTYPDEPGLLAPGWENENNKPYKITNFNIINPTYFPYTNQHFKHLIETNIIPTIINN